MPSAPENIQQSPNTPDPSHFFTFAQDVSLPMNTRPTLLLGKVLFILPAPAPDQVCLRTLHPECLEWLAAQTRGVKPLGFSLSLNPNQLHGCR